MNTKLNRISLLLTLGATISAASCDGTSPTSIANDPEAQELIGGFPAGDRRLDFAGALVAYDPRSSYYPPQAFCSASLVGTESVLTAKHCAEVINEVVSYGLTVGFAMGPNSKAPARIIPVVDFDEAPGNFGGFVGMGQDVAVLHLDSPVKDVEPVVVKSLTHKQIGQKMVAIGYGVMDNFGKSGERRIGTQTVKATQGRVFEALFGSFEAFYEWFSSQGYYAAPDGAFGSMPDAMPAPMPISDAGGSRSDAGGVSGDGGMPSPGNVDGGMFPPDAGFPTYDPTAFARYIYNSTVLLDSYEAVTGGAPGDAQPCFGDSGSPLIRYNAKTTKYEAWGVVSGGVGSEKSMCDFGTVYATFGSQVLDYVKLSSKWTDPCKDVNEIGTCVDNAATRCTTIGEGSRRLTSLDCGLLGLQCQSTPSSVSCGDTPVAGPPRPPIPGNPKDAPPFAHSANVGFKLPTQQSN